MPESKKPEITKTVATQHASAAVDGPPAPKSIQSYLHSAGVQQRIKSLLDKRAGQFTTSLMSALNSNQLLQECTPETVLSAAITAASLDLPINANLGFAYLIPYKNKKGIYEAQFQMGYKGFIQLAQRSGQYKTISATPVHDGQLVSEDPLLGNTYDWKTKKSDKVVGYVAMFQLLNGFQKDLYMPLDEMKAHGKRYSQSYRKGYGLWEDELDTMAIKTVLKLLLSKFGPMSVDMQEALVKDQAVVVDEDIIDYPDNMSELEQQVSEAKTPDDLSAILQSATVDERKKLTPMVEDRLKEIE